MREIKFRAWDKKQKRMRNVVKIQFDVKEINFVGKTALGPTLISTFFEEVEIMQYTGLKDIAGG